jgi:putative membrane protein
MLKKALLSGLCCGALCCLPAFAQTGSLDKADQSFLDTAAQTDMTEAHVGQMAQDQGNAQAVKDFGQMLVTDHTNDYNQVTALGTKVNATIPKGLDAMHDKMIAPMNKLKGAAFDHKFIQEMVAGHEKAIAQYKKAAADSQNPDVKAYAAQVLPTLEKHLDTAKDLAKSKTK